MKFEEKQGLEEKQGCDSTESEDGLTLSLFNLNIGCQQRPHCIKG
jgi:hypothetical protein